ncbi:NACHT domain-containing protein [bacterium]|nr:NACHT domain-containing protein [bacterium]
MTLSYGYLKLHTLDSTDRVDAIKLWAIFIEQTVREALPPMRYDLPLDVRQKSEFSKNSDFLAQPAQKVLEAVADSQRTVILGDPGSGKSSLLQYLALEWVEGQTSEIFKTSDVSRLPLLIELREFAITPSTNFLEFLHRGRGVDWQFDQQQLHQHLLEFPTLVMFDGLDEVFDRATQSTVIDDIIRFSQQYPNAQILVTSRIIGYNPDRLQHSGFRHFTIQSLDTDEIHEFIDRWYDLSMGSDPDKVRLKQRLKDAIVNSKAIANLADNPLLLTMMAILNRRQELPRDRADLYDQASRVLLYHWDVDHKRLNLPMDAIGRREKQEMLRLIAYEMQAGEEGLKGNVISAEHLTRLLTDYLRDQGFSEPREKANRLIQQLRERNFILCYRGADTYGFMHRTFLEYFCAVEIVHRFEKQRTLTFEQLRDEVFGQHWQDETWHEVLRLICGMIDAKFSATLIEYLMKQEMDRSFYLKDVGANDISDFRVSTEGVNFLLLAADCLSEVKDFSSVISLKSRLKQQLCYEVENQEFPLSYDATEALLNRIVYCSYTEQTLEWLKSLPVRENCRWALPRQAAIYTIGRYFHDYPKTLDWLKLQAQEDVNSGDESGAVRWSAVKAVAENYCNSQETLNWLKAIANQETDGGFSRQAAIWSLAEHYQSDPEVLSLLKSLIQQAKERFARMAAAEIIAKYFTRTSGVFELLCEAAVKDPFIREDSRQFNPRQTILESLLTHYPSHPKTFELLHNRALNDPDEQLREWAQEQLENLEGEKS